MQDYAKNLGFRYLQASSKEEFRSVMETFTHPELSDAPMLLEVFTNSEDERAACDLCLTAIPAAPRPSMFQRGLKKAVNILSSSN